MQTQATATSIIRADPRFCEALARHWRRETLHEPGYPAGIIFWVSRISVGQRVSTLWITQVEDLFGKYYLSVYSLLTWVFDVPLAPNRVAPNNRPARPTPLKPALSITIYDRTFRKRRPRFLLWIFSTVPTRSLVVYGLIVGPFPGTYTRMFLTTHRRSCCRPDPGRVIARDDDGLRRPTR